MLESRGVPSATLGFGADMAMAYNPSQMAIMQGGISGLGSSSDAVRRTINSHLMAIGGVYKDPTSQVNLYLFSFNQRSDSISNYQTLF